MKNKARITKLEKAKGKGLFAVIIPSEQDSRIPKGFYGYGVSGKELEIISKEEDEIVQSRTYSIY